MKPDNDFIFGMKRIPSLVVLACVSLGLWMAFAKLAVPRIIESAYRGESFGFLNSVITGQSELPVQFYLGLWDHIAMQVFLAALLFWVWSILSTSDTFSRKIVGEATPGTVGAIRMWTCTILLLTTMWDDLGSIAALPLEYHVDMGVMQILHQLPIGFDSFLTSEHALRFFQRLIELLLFLGAIGLWTRITVPLCAVTAFVMNGILREYSGFWHQNLVPIYILAVLSFAPCGDGCSIDRLWRIRQGRPVPDSRMRSPIYGWARYTCWVVIALTYTAAGLSKIRSGGFLSWVSASNMRALLYEQTLYPRASNFSISLHLASAPDIVFVFLGIAAMAGEAVFITVLFSRLARKIVPAMTIFMHVGIVFLQNIVFLDLMLLLLIFYDFTAVRKRISRWLSARGTIQVLHDGSSVSSQRTVRVLSAMDIFDRLSFEDHANELKLMTAESENDLAVKFRGKTCTGREAYRIIAAALPPLWPFAVLLSVPGVWTFGSRILGISIRGRLQKEVVPSSQTTVNDRSGAYRTRRSKPYVLGFSFAVALLAAALGSFWLNRFEFYPFTDMHMFTGQRDRPVVTYFKVLGHWNSGRVSPIQLEDTLAVMSINSRYEPLFDLCFAKEEPELALCRKTVSILGSAYNKKRQTNDKLVGLEIQKWKWDFGAQPNDPNYGVMEASFTGEVLPGGDAQANMTPVSIQK